MTDFDPNKAGQQNGKIFGFPYDKDNSRVIIYPMPWDVTTSYGKGTASGPQAILEASPQLDFYHPMLEKAWEYGIYVNEIDAELKSLSDRLGKRTDAYILWIENGGHPSEDQDFDELVERVNQEQITIEKRLKIFYKQCKEHDQVPVLLGGDHSTPLGLIKAYSEDYPEMGILQIDAHADLRRAYEGFEQSHASIMYNVMEQTDIKKLIQVGIRDICQEEIDYIENSKDRITTFYDRSIQASMFNGKHWGKITDEIIAQLPDEVYVSFDIDGLQPHYCPNTGTPVPSGLSYEQAVYLLQKIIISGKRIIGFDLNEVAPGDTEWDANVGARILWELNVMTQISINRSK